MTTLDGPTIAALIAIGILLFLAGWRMGWTTRGTLLRKQEAIVEHMRTRLRNRINEIPRAPLVQESWVLDMVERGEDPGREDGSPHTSPWRDRRPF